MGLRVQAASYVKELSCERLLQEPPCPPNTATGQSNRRMFGEETKPPLRCCLLFRLLVKLKTFPYSNLDQIVISTRTLPTRFVISPFVKFVRSNLDFQLLK
jgi:hypothetical protein